MRFATALAIGLLLAVTTPRFSAALGAGAQRDTSGDDLALLAEVEANQWDAVKTRGRGALDGLVRLYGGGDEARRANVARAFYVLGWQSKAATELLLGDVHTSNEGLRLQAQWALGRVSDSPVVVEVLLENMMNDPNPLFRDKAACALAYDQIHLSDVQKSRLFEGLIEALGDPKPQVRAIAIQALRIHTGQTKGFVPALPEEQRTAAIERWRAWLDDYREAL